MTALSETAVAYEDPPGVHGHGVASGGWDSDNGAVVLHPLPPRCRKKGMTRRQIWETGTADSADCTLRTSRHAWCSAVLNWELAQT